jgi:hypothetical protein
MKASKIAGLTALALLLLLVVVALVIKVRGFRASSEPTSFEASVCAGHQELCNPACGEPQEEPLSRG